MFTLGSVETVPGSAKTAGHWMPEWVSPKTVVSSALRKHKRSEDRLLISEKKKDDKTLVTAKKK